MPGEERAARRVLGADEAVSTSHVTAVNGETVRRHALSQILDLTTTRACVPPTRFPATHGTCTTSASKRWSRLVADECVGWTGRMGDQIRSYRRAIVDGTCLNADKSAPLASVAFARTVDGLW